ncbi:MAG: hypothetical protein KDI71_11015 [Xanthomonadales bacterium]|nr:hypothetical protein [Xanthomonadales bacterium]
MIKSAQFIAGITLLFVGATSAAQDLIIGSPLRDLQQGVHRSVDGGTYRGGGEYHITMKDGGRQRNFEMRFSLKAEGECTFRLQRLDVGESAVLNHSGPGLLVGGAYALQFATSAECFAKGSGSGHGMNQIANQCLQFTREKNPPELIQSRRGETFPRWKNTCERKVAFVYCAQGSAGDDACGSGGKWFTKGIIYVEPGESYDSAYFSRYHDIRFAACYERIDDFDGEGAVSCRLANSYEVKSIPEDNGNSNDVSAPRIQNSKKFGDYEWTLVDNGENVTLDQAERYCTSLGSKWSLPSLDALSELTFPLRNARSTIPCGSTTCFAPAEFKLSSHEFWVRKSSSSDEEWLWSMGVAGKSYDYNGQGARVLCTRWAK